MRIWIYCLSNILVFFVCFQRITYNFRDATGDQQVPETTIQITAEDVTLNQTALKEIKPDKRKKSQDKKRAIKPPTPSSSETSESSD